MATRERLADVGRRRGKDLSARLIYEGRTARIGADVSMRRMAEVVGWSPTAYRRFEALEVTISLVDLASVASVLGLELGAALHRVGDPIRDKGHQAVIGRFRALVHASIQVMAEVPLPNPGDRRAWDLLLRIGAQLVGVEVETRVRDIQALVRRIRERERDGGVDAILLVLADTRHNRAVVGQLREALGPDFTVPTGTIVAALSSGQAFPGSGVLLV